MLKEKAAMNGSCFIPQIQYRDNVMFTLCWFISLHVENVSFKNLEGEKTFFFLSFQVLFLLMHFFFTVLSQHLLSQTLLRKTFFSSIQEGKVSIYICNKEVWSCQ